MKIHQSISLGTVKRSTYLKAGGEFSFNDQDPLSGAAIFHGHVDFDMKLRTAVSARLGKPFFHNCLTKFNQDLPLSLGAHGKAFVSVKVIASDVRIERRRPTVIESRSLNLDLEGNTLVKYFNINDILLS